MQRQANIEKNINWLIAERGLAFSKERFPLGGINRKDIFEANPAAVLPQIQLMMKFKEKTEESPLLRIVKKRQILNSLQGSVCGDLSEAVWLKLLELYPNTCIEMVDFDNHQAVIIGRKKGNPKDIATWSDPACEAVFLDPWADEIFYVSQLPEKRKLPAIPFYIFVGANKILHTSHHYEGSPVIFEATNYHKDKDAAAIKILVNNACSTNPFSLYEKGVSCFKQKDFAKAIIHINQAIELFTKNPQGKDAVHIGTCFSTLASCYREIEDFNEAKENCLLAIRFFKINPGEESEQMKSVLLKMQKITSQLSNKTSLQISK